MRKRISEGQCLICGTLIKAKSKCWFLRYFKKHLKDIHLMSYKEYYDKYLRQDDEGICKYCGKQTTWDIERKSYRLLCNKECAAKYAHDSLWSNPEKVEKMRKIFSKTATKTNKKSWNNTSSEVRKLRAAKIIEYGKSKENRKRVSKMLKESWKDSEYRKFMIENSSKKMMGNDYGKYTKGMKKFTKAQKREISERMKNNTNKKGIKVSIEGKKNISVGAKTRWQDKEYREKISKKLKEIWSNLEFKEKMLKTMFKSRHNRPNKLEKRIDNLLQKMFPSEWKYVGDGQFWIAGKNPDFININGKKLIIEIFGNYWHEKEDESYRINLFEKFGYNTIVLWESDINNNFKEIKNKLIKFSKL